MRTRYIAGAVLACLLLGAPATAFNIEWVDMGGAAPGSVARDAFEEAAEFWEALILDDVTVRIGAGVSDEGPVWLGAAWTYPWTPNAPPAGWEWGGPVSPDWTTVRDALVASAHSKADAVAYANIPMGDTLVWRTNTYDDVGHTVFSPDPGDVTTMIDANATGNNVRMLTPRSIAKALGLLPDDGVSWDGYIYLNDYYEFDYDRSDGIGNGAAWQAFDFVGIVIHEIGHQLGFISGVDIVDWSLQGGYETFGPGFTVNDLNDGTPWAVYYPLDLFRLTQEAILAGPAVRDGAAGGDPFFSIDGGVKNLGDFDIGGYYGGWQASHWKAPPDPTGNILGLMNPWLDYNMLAAWHSRDLMAIDVIGWEVTPEPSTVVLFGAAALALGVRMRRRRRDR